MTKVIYLAHGMPKTLVWTIMGRPWNHLCDRFQQFLGEGQNHQLPTASWTHSFSLNSIEPKIAQLQQTLNESMDFIFAANTIPMY